MPILSAVRARFRAAEIRVNKATAERERLRALIPEEQPQESPRIEHPEGEYWHDWSLPQWKGLENQVYKRRARELSAESPGRAANNLPRGDANGYLHHPRRGLVGAVQDWAEGSSADAATMVFALVKELELEVRAHRARLLDGLSSFPLRPVVRVRRRRARARDPTASLPPTGPPDTFAHALPRVCCLSGP